MLLLGHRDADRNHRASDYYRSLAKPMFYYLKSGGRYWDRTSDPFHVKEVRYRCANRPKCELYICKNVYVPRLEVETGFEPV